MRSWCAILLMLLALSASACSSNPQIDRPTEPDRRHMVDQQMQFVQRGASYVDVLSLVGKPDKFSQGTSPEGQHVVVARWVGVHTWTLIFSNTVNDYGNSTGRLQGGLYLYDKIERS